MNVLIVEPDKAPRPADIKGDLPGLQRIVGGEIEVDYFYDDPVGLAYNADGKNIGLDLSRAIYDMNGQLVEIVAGTFVIIGVENDRFTSLTPDLMEKYQNMFKEPQRFTWDGQGMCVLPMRLTTLPF